MDGIISSEETIGGHGTLKVRLSSRASTFWVWTSAFRSFWIPPSGRLPGLTVPSVSTFLLGALTVARAWGLGTCYIPSCFPYPLRLTLFIQGPEGLSVSAADMVGVTMRRVPF